MTRAICFLVLTLVAACTAGTGEETAPAAPVALVELASAAPGPIEKSTTLYGTIEPGAGGEYALSAPVETVVAAIELPVGAAVQTGQVIARLRPSPATRAAATRAEADAQAADAAQARALRLRADGLASDADVETARAAAAAADALRASVDAQAAGLVLRARAAGHVTSTNARLGDIVAAGTAVVSITRLDGLRARFGIAPDVAVTIAPGAPFTLLPPVGPPLALTVAAVDPAADPQTRLASLYARVPATAGLGAGVAVSARLVTGSASVLPTIPYAALLDDGGQPFVFVVKDGVAHRRDVRPDLTDGERVAIAEGLATGERVVVAGGTALEDGIDVREQ